MKHIRKISEYAVIGGLGAILAAGLAGCEQKDNNSNVFENAAQKQGAFVVIEETAPGRYIIVDEYPSSETRVILKDINGTEKVLSQEELDVLIREEAARIEAGQSPLTNPQIQNQGMGLGGIILASAAGAILGSWIGNKLFNNPAYQQQRQRSYKSPSTYQRSVESFKRKAEAKKSAKKSSGKSGFFGSGSSRTSGSKFSFGG
ncbi:UPF0323 family lipoprotein [Nitrosophilus alvini]|uniref:UPF0323 family lipoprotein n=1 Tax=Nitrosophilus alvini TaxID=2714855 RepID=UPI00190CF5B9|nr:UPF0323 family lipoprotein [Nitrosophilus alvini]